MQLEQVKMMSLSSVDREGCGFKFSQHVQKPRVKFKGFTKNENYNFLWKTLLYSRTPQPFGVVLNSELHTYVTIWTNETRSLKNALKHIIHEGFQGNFSALSDEINLPKNINFQGSSIRLACHEWNYFL
jgi:hypothetical protein